MCGGGGGGERGEREGEVSAMGWCCVSKFTKSFLQPKSFQLVANSKLPSLGSK